MSHALGWARLPVGASRSPRRRPFVGPRPPLVGCVLPRVVRRAWWMRPLRSVHVQHQDVVRALPIHLFTCTACGAGESEHPDGRGGSMLGTSGASDAPSSSGGGPGAGGDVGNNGEGGSATTGGASATGGVSGADSGGAPPSRDPFDIVTAGTAVDIYVDAADFPAVVRAVGCCRPTWVRRRAFTTKEFRDWRTSHLRERKLEWSWNGSAQECRSALICCRAGFRSSIWLVNAVFRVACVLKPHRALNTHKYC